jgi:hypothetical protein
MESENRFYENLSENRMNITNMLINCVLGGLVIYNLYQINKNLQELHYSVQEIFM